LNASPHTLPVESVLPEILHRISENSIAIISASPGAGKTTRVPLALADHPSLPEGKIVMLEPRRLAAQRAAEYMALLRGEEVGHSIGYRIRGASRVSPLSRIVVVTEGILTRMIQDDPELPGVSLLLFDEFHERTIHADLGLALALDAQSHVRPDLRIAIMSATLDGIGLARLLPDAPVIQCPGRQFPVETVYASFDTDAPIERTVSQAVTRALDETEGDILVFLPGRRELRRTRDILLDARLPHGVHVHLLHGEADPHTQRSALTPAPGGDRKVILSTSVAETSLTIDGVSTVIDGGLARVPRFDPRRGMTGLVTLPVSAATADQRRGRAGRQGPGVCYRLWTEDEQRKLEPYPMPEILTADLAPLALELARWGAPDASSLRLIDPPPRLHLAHARELLASLGALEPNGRISSHGRAMSALPIHPRLAHMVVTAGRFGLASDACTVAALLDGPRLRGAVQTMDVDLATAIHALDSRTDGDRAARMLIRSEADRLRRMVDAAPNTVSDQHLGQLLALAYPDRVARRRGDGSRHYLLANGTGATLPDWSLLSRSEFLAVGEVDNAGVEAKILMAAPVTVDDIREVAEPQLTSSDEVGWNTRESAVVARHAVRLGAILIDDRPTALVGDAVIMAMIEGVKTLGLEALPWSSAALSLRSRCEWIRRNNIAGSDWPELSNAALLESLDRWLAPHLEGITRKEYLDRLDLARILGTLLTPGQRTMLDRLAPTHLPTPGGTRVALVYGDERQPVMPVRLQEMFGQTSSPTVGGGSINVILHLLSPAGRPLAVTSDLRSFWGNAYIDVRKQMRGRYPKHRWPENPLEAVPGPSRKGR
jgi:ATP-dependent helicase HrpB